MMEMCGNPAATQVARVWVTPTELDVFTGSRCRSPLYYNHPGNVKFRKIIFAMIEIYSTRRTTKEKTIVIRHIISHVFDNGGRFLQFDRSVNKWYDGGLSAAKARVQIALRDAVTPGKVGWVAKEMKLMARQQVHQSDDSSASESGKAGCVGAGEQPDEIISVSMNRQPTMGEHESLNNSGSRKSNKVETEIAGVNASSVIITAAAKENRPDTTLPGNTFGLSAEPLSNQHISMLQQLPTTFLATEKATLWQPHDAGIPDPVKMQMGSSHAAGASNGSKSLPGVCPIDVTPTRCLPPADEDSKTLGKKRRSLAEPLFLPAQGQCQPLPKWHSWHACNLLLSEQGASSLSTNTDTIVPNFHGIPSFQQVTVPTARRLVKRSATMMKQAPIFVDRPAASMPFKMANHRDVNNVCIPERLVNDSGDASLRLLLSKQLSEAKEMEKRHTLERLQIQKAEREMVAAKLRSIFGK